MTPSTRAGFLAWIKKHYIFDDIVREDDPSEVQFTSFADLWPLFEEISLVSHR